MKRDMELMRKLLFAIEEQYEPGEITIFSINIPDYDTQTIAEHCDLIFQAGFIKSYEPITGGGRVLDFTIGNLTNPGYEYLELIRNEEVWGKTKTEIEKKKLPHTFEAIAKVAGVFVGNIIKELNE